MDIVVVLPQEPAPQISSTLLILLPLIGTIIGGVLSIIGVVLSNKWLLKRQIKTETEKKKVEMFGIVYDQLYFPFLSIHNEINEQGEVNLENEVKLIRFFNEKTKFIILCPIEIRNTFNSIRNDMEQKRLTNILQLLNKAKTQIEEVIRNFTYNAKNGR